MCVACRRSLMGAPEQEVAKLLEFRAAALAGDERSSGRAPWGPALAAFLEARGDAAESGGSTVATLTYAETVVSPDPVSITPNDVVADRPTLSDGVAETTRLQLARLYDTRVAPPSAPPSVPTSPSTNAKATAAPAPRRETSGRPIPQERKKPRGRVLLVIVVLVVGLFGVRAARHALADQANATAQNPKTPVDKLPWRFVQYGDLTMNVPIAATTKSGDAGGAGTYRYERYVLPDVTLSVTVHVATNALGTEAGLRSYANGLAEQAGGRLTSGFARDVTFGTAFSASIELPAGSAYLYVLSTRNELIEVQADLTGSPGVRATRIYEQLIRSITPT